MRLAILTLSSALVTCGAHTGPSSSSRATAASTVTPTDASSGGPEEGPSAANELDPNVARPEPGSALAEARAALDAGQPERARAIATAALARPDAVGEGPAPRERESIRWVAAEAARALDDDEAAAEHLRHITAGPLAPWAALVRADGLVEPHPAEALAVLEPLSSIEFPGTSQVQLLRARALLGLDRGAEAEPLLRSLVAETPDRYGAASAAMPLADRLAESDDVARREEALALYRRVATRAPLSTTGTEAKEKAEAVLASLPPERRRELRELPAHDALARAHALYAAVHHAEAETAFAEVAERLEKGSPRWCAATLYQGRAIVRQRQRPRIIEHMKVLAQACEEPSMQAWARYYAGRAHAALGHNRQAIAQYDALRKAAPEHRLADDAIYRSALAARDAGDLEAMTRRLEELPKAYPRGDMRGDGQFILAWRFYRQGKHDDALEQLDQLLAEGPQENQEDLLGRARYWRARTLSALGRTDEAIEGYEALAQRYPLSYYAQQALVRLGKLAPSRRAQLVEAMGGRDGTTVPALTFPRRPEMAEPGFERAVELLRVGAIGKAERELEALGLTGEGADADHLWLAAALLDRAGAYPKSCNLVRRRLPSVRRTMPAGRARALWRLAYPRAYAPLIEQIAADAEVPPSFVRAVAREESGFNPRAVSVAHAYGLIQVIQPTAERFAEMLDLEADRAALHDPETNLRIGAQFIAYLRDRFEENPAVVPSAYNAGEGAARRWIRARGDLPLDEWIEEIPYDETRRYTRRVLQTYGIYRWLDTGQLPELPQRIGVKPRGARSTAEN